MRGYFAIPLRYYTHRRQAEAKERKTIAGTAIVSFIYLTFHLCVLALLFAKLFLSGAEGSV